MYCGRLGDAKQKVLYAGHVVAGLQTLEERGLRYESHRLVASTGP